MNLDFIENFVRLTGSILAYVILAVLFIGIWRGTRRKAGRVSGTAGSWLRSPLFYLVTTALFFGICWFGWKPMPFVFSAAGRTFLLAGGSFLYFPGIALVLWGRLSLGKNYFVSTGMGAQVLEGQDLVTSGPYAFVRHPMYTGIFFAALGSALLYRTWTAGLFACFAPFLVLRARREENVLAAEFGEGWREYSVRVPSFFPRLGR